MAVVAIATIVIEIGVIETEIAEIATANESIVSARIAATATTETEIEIAVIGTWTETETVIGIVLKGSTGKIGMIAGPIERETVIALIVLRTATGIVWNGMIGPTAEGTATGTAIATDRTELTEAIVLTVVIATGTATDRRFPKSGSAASAPTLHPIWLVPRPHLSQSQSLLR